MRARGLSAFERGMQRGVRLNTIPDPAGPGWQLCDDGSHVRARRRARTANDERPRDAQSGQGLAEIRRNALAE